MADLTSIADIVAGIVGSNAGHDACVDYIFDLSRERGRDILLAAHYHLMANKRYWYDDADKAASTILCVLASILRQESAPVQ